MKAINAIRMGGTEILPLVEGGKGVAVTNGMTAGHWAASGGAGTFSAVNADSYEPCLPAGGVATIHCDLLPTDPGANPGDAPAQQGFAAQLGFRLPNLVISPFARKHYVSHIPMDHTAIIKFVENRFISSSAHLTNRDAAQPNLLDFFDFQNIPWATPPTPPAPSTPPGQCTPSNM